MTPVDQINFQRNTGDCFSACLATLLDIPLSEVPNFRAAEQASMDSKEVYIKSMDHMARVWLGERGLSLVGISFNNEKDLHSHYWGYNILCILSGQSPRKNEDGSTKRHCVVGCTKGYEIEVIHDPHPDRTGVTNEQHYYVYFIVPKSQEKQ